MIIKSLLTVATCVLVSGCGSQFAGTWNGTADIGPIDALTMTVVMPKKGLDGKLTIRTKDGTKTYQICQAELKGDRFEVQYDEALPDCTKKKGVDSDLRTLKGTLGVTVIFGQVFKGKQQIGFFRAFRKPTESSLLKFG